MVTHEPDMAAFADRERALPRRAHRERPADAAGADLMLSNTLVLALRAIRRNALRSSLTMLGIVIGVAAVIAMVTLGSGATREGHRRHLEPRRPTC